MKNFKSTLLLFLIFIGGNLAAQNWYIQAGAGYGIGFPGNMSSTIEADTSKFMFHAENIRLGGGLQANLSFGVMVEDNWGLDFQFYYQNNLGKVLESESSYLAWDPNGGRLETIYWESEINTQSVGFSPALLINADLAPLNPFLSIGPVVYYNWTKERNIMEGEGMKREVVMETKGRLSFGAQARAGLEFELSSSLLFNAALEFRTAYFKPRTTEMTTYKYNGESELENLFERDIKTEYVDSFDQDEEINQDEPYKELTTILDYSSLSLQLGIKILL